MNPIVNVLADRYASVPMKEIWSPEGRIVMEREFWIAVMKAQQKMGIDIPDEAIEAYERVKNKVDLDSINSRERITRHDVKARIEEFCDLAGFEQIHKGMTSRDLTENVEQVQIYRSLRLIHAKAVAALKRMAERAEQYKTLVMTARTHNVAAQPTTLGKRIAMFGEELAAALTQLDFLIDRFSVRGVKGAVGTCLDLLTLFNGETAKIEQFEKEIADYLGIPRTLNAVGQVYPRSLDYAVVSALVTLASPLSSFAKTLRLMAGNETAAEGFAKGQVGSSAMPHKMNSRSCERINGFKAILCGYAEMLAALDGDQWNEGDVSCSVVRRVALPDAFFAADGMLETFLNVLDRMEVFSAVIERENRYYFPFLATTTILMEAVKHGAGRETAHEAIKEHAVAVVRDLRNGAITQNDLAHRLAADSRIGLSEEKLQSIIDKAADLTGMAARQTETFVRQAQEWITRFPEEAAYKPGDIL